MKSQSFNSDFFVVKNIIFEFNKVFIKKNDNYSITLWRKYFMLLSVAMIVKNEEKNLDRCLKSLKSLDNILNYEIVIVDTGSEDDTINIAKKYTNKVYEKLWTNNFAEMRNISIDFCKGEWILVLDADEVLENPKALIKFFKEGSHKKFNSATIKFKNMLSDKEDDYLIGTLVRLFKNKKEFYYEGRIHEQPKILAPVALTNITLLHYGYSRVSYKLMQYKYKRNLQLLLKDLEEEKDLIYTHFQLAQTYGMANKGDKAFESISNAYRLVQQKINKSEYLYVYHFIAMKLASIGNYERAIEISEEAISYSKEHLDFYYILAKGYFSINKYDKADKYFNEYFRLHEKLDNGYIVKDIRVNNLSYCKKEEMIKEKIIMDFKNENFEFITKSYLKLKEESDKNQLKEIYIFSLLKKLEYSKVFRFFNENKIKESDISSIISIVDKLNKDKLYKSGKSDIKSIYKKLVNLDTRLDAYIKFISDDYKIDDLNIKFSEYYSYKAEMLKELLLKGKVELKILEDLRNDDQYNYINFISKDYECLDILIEYCKENFLATDIKILSFLTKIEEILIRNQSINSEEYIELIKRAYVNKLNYIEIVYNSSIVDKYREKILSRSELMCVKLKEAFDYYESSQVEYIKVLRQILKDYPEYTKLVEILTTKVQDKDISKAMIEEKNKILSNVQLLISNNNIEESEEILKEIEAIFIYDGEIKNYLGVIKYLKGQNESALVDFALSMKLREEKFEATYNIAILLSDMKKVDKAKYYYEVALKICKDDKVKEEINNILQG